MAENPRKIVLDSNIIISALIYGGKPEQVLKQVLQGEFEAISSSYLFQEVIRVLTIKFNFSPQKLFLIELMLKTSFRVVKPKLKLDIQQDEADNRVLEAAIEGGAQFIVTGDKELLELKEFRSVQIVSAAQFTEEDLTKDL